MPEPMNFYETVKWIRDHDASPGRRATYAAEFVLNQHTMQRISSENLFEMLKELMIVVIRNAGYDASTR